MLQTVKATVDTNGTVHLSEPLRVAKTTQALVTLLEETNLEESEEPGNAAKMLQLLRSPEFKNRKSYNHEEIEAQIEENRNSWD